MLGIGCIMNDAFRGCFLFDFITGIILRKNKKCFILKNCLVANIYGRQYKIHINL